MTQSYESLAEYYAGEYLDKILYFCLKKTGSPERAEDLAQEISLCVLEELHRGVIPESFSGWVCQYDIIRTNGKILDFQGVLAFVGAHSIPFPALKGGTN